MTRSPSWLVVSWSRSSHRALTGAPGTSALRLSAQPDASDSRPPVSAISSLAGSPRRSPPGACAWTTPTPLTPPPVTAGATAPAGSCLRTRRSSRPRCSWTPRTPWCAGAGAPTPPGWPTQGPWRALGRGPPVRISWPLSRPWPPVAGAWTSWSGPPAPARPPHCPLWWRPGRPSTGPARSPPWHPPRRPPRSSASPWERRQTTPPCGSRCAAPPPSATATWTFCVRPATGSTRAAVWRTSATPSRSLTPPPRACPGSDRCRAAPHREHPHAAGAPGSR